jgi:threonine/homoserine efflux transporter RhtA
VSTAERIREQPSALPLQGVARGIVAAVTWAVYNVGAKVGAAQGFRPADLTVIRFGVAGLIMLPLLARAGWCDVGGLG